MCNDLRSGAEISPRACVVPAVESRDSSLTLCIRRAADLAGLSVGVLKRSRLCRCGQAELTSAVAAARASGMTSTASPPPSVDLRKTPVPEIMDRVERAFGTRLDRDAMVFKRRSIGATSDRGTWVRIERRPSERVGSQGWGIECAASLEGVAMPAWFSGASWCDPDGAAVWRVDEIELLPAMPLRRGGPLLVDPELPDDWWATLNRSLDALAATRTTRIASPDTVEVSQQHVEDVLGRAFRVNFDPTVTEWTVAHADLNWANVTGPDFLCPIRLGGLGEGSARTGQRHALVLSSRHPRAGRPGAAGAPGGPGIPQRHDHPPLQPREDPRLPGRDRSAARAGPAGGRRTSGGTSPRLLILLGPLVQEFAASA